MLGSFISRILLMTFGYVYPAYECFKIVEKSKPEIEQLLLWSKYWILVAMITVLERIGDPFMRRHQEEIDQNINELRSKAITTSDTNDRKLQCNHNTTVMDLVAKIYTIRPLYSQKGHDSDNQDHDSDHQDHDHGHVHHVHAHVHGRGLQRVYLGHSLKH
ncbi:hypothetical protein F8388_016077 [Cannabis sativa]|uniref:HVA22-like protein n=1 Tax=Cannabis sativa TaxID=3483 RepID=A0A7J6FUT7_CANSA|nr:hypothetical protein F8388_016077 [Cannabis sativa]